MKMTLILALAFGGLLYGSAATNSAAVGVLVGLHHIGYSDYLNGPPRPPAGGSLRTIWISIQNSTDLSGTELVEIPDLMLPRRSGFWRAGLLATCSEETDDRGDADVYVSDHLWVTVPGRTPTVTLGADDRIAGSERIGPCSARNIRCVADTRTQIDWVWPEYVSMNLGGESSCGAHPSSSSAPTVRHIDNPSRPVTILQVLGSAPAAQMRDSFDAARREHFAEACKAWPNRPDFDPESWNIRREPGRWRVQGWAETERLCGYGFDYTAEIDLSKVTGRTGDNGSTLARVKEKSSQMKDAHAGPSGWILAITETELLLIPNATTERMAVRVPISRDDHVIMVEWATGPNVARWSNEIRKSKTASPREPRVIRLLRK